jgi:hypothetical protein
MSRVVAAFKIGQKVRRIIVVKDSDKIFDGFYFCFCFTGSPQENADMI